MTLSRSKVGRDRFTDIKNALFVLFIANTTVWIGNLVQTINTGETLFEPNLIQLDLGLIYIYSNLFLFADDPVLVGFAVLGWIFGSIWARKNVDYRHSEIMVLSVILPLVIPIVFMLVVVLTLAIGSFDSSFLIIIPVIIILVIGSSIIGIVLTLPGMVISNLIKPKGKTKPTILSDSSHLLLSVDPYLLNEKVLHCPFRMKEKSGCSFLGYEAPNKPLICDYSSQWKICYIYAHLYKKVEVK